MLHIEIFELSKKGAKEANAFIADHRLIENGMQVRDTTICVLYETADHFDAKSKEVALIGSLSSAEAQLVKLEVEREYFNLMQEGGVAFSAEDSNAKSEVARKIDALHAQIFIFKKMLGRETEGTVVFGKKMYRKTEKEDKKAK